MATAKKKKKPAKKEIWRPIDHRDFVESMPQPWRSWLRRLKNIINEAIPEAEHVIKWSMPCWSYEEVPIVTINLWGDVVSVGFHDGIELRDRAKVLDGKGKHIRFYRVEKASDIRPDLIAEYVKEAFQISLGKPRPWFAFYEMLERQHSSSRR